MGFSQINKDGYVAQVGDIVVWNKTPKNPHGHIQIYNGTQWVSDFRQPNFNPYRDKSSAGSYTIWRDLSAAGSNK
ncbi:hypothetical protein ACFBZI_11330 [Moraxella sp. ZJ142]|uniref:hypothetical protein n=1 Tax=Moraxella marmotae TaxID=3344520 RepID=UPI0035D50F98